MTTEGFSKNDLVAILNNSSEIVFVMDPKGNILWLNEAACQKLGISVHEWIGKKAEDAVKEGYIDHAVVCRAMETGKEVSDIVKRFLLGKDRDTIVRCKPIYNQEGEIKFFVSTSTICNEFHDLLETLEKVKRERNRFLMEIEHLRNSLFQEDDYIFESKDMKPLLEDIKKIAPIDCNVIITGESGVGKEIISKLIHKNSHRRDKPFITVCIPAIPENLLEAEIFGYEEGAFTGTVRGGKIGLFELAQGGTLFLDEIGDIPYSVQVKLLRAIENGEILRLGGTKTKKLDVRIIAATNRNLQQMIEQELFRGDLFYRLSTVHLEIKPLRERTEDIRPLCKHFIKQFNEKHKTSKKISEEALKSMENFSWPGNVRELKNIVERLCILSDGNLITKEDIKSILRDHMEPTKNISGINHKKRSMMEENIPKTLVEEYSSYEGARIIKALKEVGGNKSKAAEILGMSRSKLHRILKEPIEKSK